MLHTIEVLRYSTTKTDTLSIILADGKFIAYGLEDTYRAEKIKHETRVPSGTYKLAWQMELTKMTVRYQVKYPFFYRHLEVKNVPEFTGIYIHIGNSKEDTSGCLVIGDEAVSNVNSTPGKLKNSTAAYERVYRTIKAWLDLGHEIEITFKNI